MSLPRDLVVKHSAKHLFEEKRVSTAALDEALHKRPWGRFTEHLTNKRAARLRLQFPYQNLFKPMLRKEPREDLVHLREQGPLGSASPSCR